MKALNIVSVDLFRPNGPSSSVIQLGNGLVRGGVQTALLSATPVAERINTLMKVLPSPKVPHWNPWLLSEAWVSIIEEQFGVPDWVEFNSVYIPFQTALARLIRRKRKWPYIVTPRGALNPLAQNIKPLKKVIGNVFFNNSFINNATAIHALTDEEAKGITQRFPKVKIIVSPNGVSQELLTLDERVEPFPINRGSNTITLVFLGRIAVYHKGIDLLIKAIRKVQKNHKNIDLQLLMVGSFGSSYDKKSFEDLLRVLPYPQAVKVVGVLMGNNKWAYLLAGDIFVHTSRFEGMPNAVLEAMSLGKPCLVTPGSHMQSFVRSGVAGWTPEGHIDAIANVLVEISQNRAEICIRGANAKKYVQKYLMWDKIAANYIEKLKKIL